MKVNPLSNAMRWIEAVGGKRDREDGAGGEGYTPDRRERREGRPSPAAAAGVTEKSPEELQAEVQAAVDAFEADARARQNGLHATMMGQGNALRIVLKDGRGGVIRQCTAEEFLRLRQAAVRDPRVRGNILDQKL